jgi:uncharacterized protein (DUF488 family)
VADVRTMPRSRKNPQYNTDVLPGALAAHGLGYRHIAALGGLRSRTKTVPPEVNAFWQNRSFHNYADYAMTAPFRRGLDELLAIGSENPCAIMCAEGLWWRCHRRIIADYLVARGEAVSHILPGGEVAPAQLTEAARRVPEGALSYPAPDLLDGPPLSRG